MSTDENTPSTNNDLPKKRRRGIYLLPNLLTTAAMFAGFYAIVASIKGQYEPACIALLAAMILDGLDGRVARLTNTQTEFGAQYDSMSDLTSFGLAPALLSFQWALNDLNKIGWLGAFVYAAAAALRLARFNSQVHVADKRFFQGLPSPTAAGLIVGTVWMASEYGMANGKGISYLMLLVTIAAALLMVSNIRFYSFKGSDFQRRQPFVTGLIIVLVFALVALNPAMMTFGVSYLYTLSGVIFTLIQIRRRRLARRAGQEHSV